MLEGKEVHTRIVVQRRGWAPTNVVRLIAKLDATESLPIQCPHCQRRLNAAKPFKDRSIEAQ